MPEAETQLREPTVPLFRARLIGLGFDPERELVLLELRERAADEDDEDEDEDDDEDDVAPAAEGEADPGYVARIYATRAQVRAMAARGAEAVDRRATPVSAVRHADGSRRAPVSPLELTPDELADVLGAAELDVVGRMRYSSNATFLVEARLDGIELSAVYKPRRGERPLWDFPQGTLCNREVAAYELSRALDWGVVPVTILRDGPLGSGAVQRFVEHDPDEHYFTLLEGREDRFRQFAVFDVLANNTDRKGGHCLHDEVNDLDRRYRPRAHVPSRVEAPHRDLGLCRGARPRRRCRRRVPSARRARRRPARRAARRAPLRGRGRGHRVSRQRAFSNRASPTPTTATAAPPGRWSDQRKGFSGAA